MAEAGAQSGSGQTGQEGAAQGAQGQAQGQAAGGADGAGAQQDQGQQAAEGQQQQPATQPQTDWKDRRIAQLTAKLREAQASAATAGTGQQQQQQSQPVAAAAAPAAGTAEFQQAVAAEAARQAEINNFNSACDAAAADGRSRFGKAQFEGAVNTLMQLVDRNDPSTLLRYNAFLNAAMAAGDAPALIMEAARDLNEASKLLEMPAVRMAVELTRRVTAMKAQAGAGAGEGQNGLQGQQQQQHRPLNGAGVGSRGSAHVPIDPADSARSGQLSVSDWMTRREAQVAEARKSRPNLR